MDSLTILGTARSRAARCLIAAEELGLDYNHLPIRPGHDSPDRRLLLSVNPNGRIPVLVDGETRLWEAMAINLYLGRKAGGPLWPESEAGQGALFQWSFWVMTEMDRSDWREDRSSLDVETAARANMRMTQTMGVLEQVLSETRFLTGDDFSLADVNVASAITQPGAPGQILWRDFDWDAARLPSTKRWVDHCFDRASWRRVAELD